MEVKRVVIGTRGSELALKQCEIVKRKLLKSHPGLEVEFKIIKTQGDTNASPIPLDTIGKGWFTKEIESELLDGSIDLAVHSLKDLPEVLPPGLAVAAYPEREDPRDCMVSKSALPLEQLASGSVIGTDSTRRQIQILALRRDLTVQSMRGNVPTRLKKAFSPEYDAAILAAAGLKRLGLENQITQYFEPEKVTPAPGQGILAIEIRQDNQSIKDLISAVNDPEAETAAIAERNFSKIIGGGCKEPVGAYAKCAGELLTLLGMLGLPEGGAVYRDQITGKRQDAELLSAELAERILAHANFSHVQK